MANFTPNEFNEACDYATYILGRDYSPNEISGALDRIREIKVPCDVQLFVDRVADEIEILEDSD